MAMTTGPGPQMNVTPMIDVLLVLIIIFMVILPNTRGLETQVPQPSDPKQAAQVKPQDDIVLTVEGKGRVLVNREPVSREALAERLADLFKTTAQPVVFVQGKGDLAFEEVAQVIDLAKGAGFARVALMDRSGE